MKISCEGCSGGEGVTFPFFLEMAATAEEEEESTTALLCPCFLCKNFYDVNASFGRLECRFHPLPKVEPSIWTRLDDTEDIPVYHHRCCGASSLPADRFHYEKKGVQGCVRIDHCRSEEEFESIKQSLVHPIPDSVCSDEQTNRFRRLERDQYGFHMVNAQQLERTITLPGIPPTMKKSIHVDPKRHYDNMKKRILNDHRDEFQPFGRLIPRVSAESQEGKSNSPFSVLYGQAKQTKKRRMEILSSVLENNLSASGLSKQVREREEQLQSAILHHGYWASTTSEKEDNLLLLRRGGDDDDEKEDVDPKKDRDYGNNEFDSRTYYNEISDTRVKLRDAQLYDALRLTDDSEQQQYEEEEGGGGVKMFVPFWLIRRVSHTFCRDMIRVMRNRGLVCLAQD